MRKALILLVLIGLVYYALAQPTQGPYPGGSGGGGGGSGTNGYGTQIISPTDGTGNPLLLPFITTPTFDGVIGETHNNTVALLYWNFGGTSNGWKGNWDIPQALQILQTQTNIAAATPLVVKANGAIGNQTNGDNVNDAQGVIFMQNQGSRNGGGAAIFAEMGSNNYHFKSGYSTVDANAVQFGTVNQGGDESRFSGTLGMIADQGIGTYGYPWVFGGPQNVGSESTAPNHEFFGYDPVNDVFWMPLVQQGIFTHTNAAAIPAFILFSKTGSGGVYSNWGVGGTLTVTNGTITAPSATITTLNCTTLNVSSGLPTVVEVDGVGSYSLTASLADIGSDMHTTLPSAGKYRITCILEFSGIVAGDRIYNVTENTTDATSSLAYRGLAPTTGNACQVVSSWVTTVTGSRVISVFSLAQSGVGTIDKSTSSITYEGPY